MRILTVIGNRPQFVKAAAVSRRLRRDHEEVLVHTGQHYDDELSRVFFDELGVPAAGPRAGHPARAPTPTQTARMLAALEPVRGRGAPAWCWSTATPTPRWPGRWPAAQARRAGGARGGGHALLRPARCPRSSTGCWCDHAQRPAAVLDGRPRWRTCAASAWPGGCELVGDVMADVALTSGRAARARRSALEGSACGPASTCCHRSSGRQRRRSRAAERPGGAARGAARCPRCSRCTRAPAPGWRQAGLLARLEAAPTLTAGPAAGLPGLHRPAVSRPRRADRLGRGAEGGLPGRRAVHDPARHAPSGSRRWTAGWNMLVGLDAPPPAPPWSARPRRRAPRALRRRASRRARRGRSPTCACGALHSRAHEDRDRRSRATSGSRWPSRSREAGTRGDRRRRGRRSRRGAVGGASSTSRTSPTSAWRRAPRSCRSPPTTSDLSGADAVLICVPTPLTTHREPELAALLAAAGPRWPRCWSRASWWCWSRPPTPAPPASAGADAGGAGLAPGEDFNVAFSPERIDPGRTDYTIRNTPKVVGGLTPACTDRAQELYRDDLRRDQAVARPRWPSCPSCWRTSSARSTSRWSTSWRCWPTAWASTCGRSIDAAATKPFGFMRFDPGPGMGGHCLPVDPSTCPGRRASTTSCTEFIELAGKINQGQPYFCVLASPTR